MTIGDILTVFMVILAIFTVTKVLVDGFTDFFVGVLSCVVCSLVVTGIIIITFAFVKYGLVPVFMSDFWNIKVL